MYPLGIGIYHSGVEVHGTEYSFGGHEYDFSGIFQVTPKVGPPNVHFRESITMGRTTLSQPDTLKLMDRMAKKYTGRSYHLLQK